MSKEAILKIDDQELSFPIIEGTEKERAVDLRTLRAKSGGYITYDEGFGNTGSCQSEITFIDGEKGILRYRGYPIEQLAEKSDFIESAYLIINGELPTKKQRAHFSNLISENAAIDERMHRIFEGYPRSANPMSILAAMMNSLACFYPHLATNDRATDLENFEKAAAFAISKVRTITAAVYRVSQGLPIMYPKKNIGYCDNFLHMMFSEPYDEYPRDTIQASALNLILLLHADHEQNCSTSTVRMVGSGGANLFASISAGVSALWGPLHGGANLAVIQMLEAIHAEGDDGSKFIEEAKSGKSNRRLMGFGHRVYKNFDPRAKIIGKACDQLLNKLGISDPCLDIARKLEQAALADDYFISRNLYPNVDFYSGIIMRALGIPVEMFTVMFAIGRMPGWVANWMEVSSNPKGRISRPRQVYQGPAVRDYVPIADRG
ncbi:citrate synthase [Pelagicoccus sp. SDUM812003]|uniref:citrate synthase n=1 Tax=Pelagicoccus sp. SDUM812003 TaxID=3041267 RepID=UPI00280D2186|nr:citrate synthase [Pelagicoccus sp. SDUM812003]MDQ8204822.1 citrate synthase [Pelagicoccus sp. SDUM812003]